MELLRALPEISQPVPRSAHAASEDVEDPLREIDPAAYIAALTGREPRRDRKVACPFHEDRTPSLHVYEAPENGWYCFGCRRGGDVYDFGGAMLGLSTDGREFLELRRRLYELLLPGREPPAPRRRRERRVPGAR